MVINVYLDKDRIKTGYDVIGFIAQWNAMRGQCVLYTKDEEA